MIGDSLTKEIVVSVGDDPCRGIEVIAQPEPMRRDQGGATHNLTHAAPSGQTEAGTFGHALIRPATAASRQAPRRRQATSYPADASVFTSLAELVTRFFHPVASRNIGALG